MSRRYMTYNSASAPCPATSAPVPESPEVKAFVRSEMERFGLTEEEVRKRAIEAYGSVECTMKAMEIGEAQNKAVIERAFPNGIPEIQIGRKPKLGEEVKFTQLRENLMIRVWGGDLATYQRYCFDFVNCDRQYILKPKDVKIYIMPTTFTPSLPVLSMEDTLEKAKSSLYSHATRCDPNWETYIVYEGSVLRITQKNHPDRFLHIPMRIPHDSTLVLQPW